MTSVSSQPVINVSGNALRLSHREEVISKVFAILLFILLVFQKFGIPSAVRPIPLIVPSIWIAIAFLLIRGQARIDYGRLILFSTFAVFAIFGNLMLISGFKISSLSIVLIIYALFVFRIDVSDQLYRTVMATFINLVMLTLPVIIIQWALQIVIHPGLWLNIEQYVPNQFLISDFMYYHPIKWNSPWIQPNAAIFLEVSILSQFLTLALILEVSLFQRLRYLIALGIAMLATLAASGPFMLALCVPFMLVRMSRRVLFSVLAAVVVVVIATRFTDIFSILLSRVGEAVDPTSSTYVRIVLPTRVFLQYLSSLSNPFQGLGAGNADELNAFLPLAKLTLEYGLVAAVCLFALFVYTIGTSRSPVIVMWAVFVFYNLMGGGFATPIYPITSLLLCGLLVRRTAPTGERDHRSGRATFRPTAQAGGVCGLG